MNNSNLPLKRLARSPRFIQRQADRLAERRENDNSVMAIQNEMNRLFDQFFSDPFTLVPFAAARIPVEFSPRVDVSETATEIRITAELPGMDEKDIQISLENDALILSGEKKTEAEEKEKNYHRIERTFGSFQRVIPLACEVDEAKVNAVFKNGVLTIALPKPPENVKQARKIAIKKE